MIVHTLLGKKTKYHVLQEGEWAIVGSHFACCDCGLVHDIKYSYFPEKEEGQRLWHSMKRNPKRTAALRRGRKAEIAKRLGV